MDRTSPTGYGLLDGRVALITGGARNIGRAIAMRCGAEGAAVAVADVDADRVTSVADEIEQAGGTAFGVAVDMSTEEGVGSAFESVEQRFGLVDVLINNAYARGPRAAWGPFLHVTPSAWDEFTRVNLGLLFHPTHRMASALAERGRKGTIVNISSHGAARAHRNYIPYDTVKGGTDSFTRSVAVDLAPWGIRVNGLRPGAVEVDSDDPDPHVRRHRAEQIPLGRAGVPDDIASSAIYLASDLSQWVTGQTFNVDGGMAAQARAPQVETQRVWTPANIADHRPGG
ncbi:MULTISPECIES: SDR family NAD(P)-dependent oxidoreductase [Prauserella salsuginis group]|uniref:SDR family NAD(P)-dependent oxidoreductase n=1 Tax=Prauserella salsuginis TaxID=387889 RepID=A0ABW6G0X0_9PSEU|nr:MULTISPECIES: SDR family oxidoreductase [Prauserella salsuginis group]MCR3721997.1 3-oxoacyl-[acyl-carrier protein] reductase [Prauserella flava]MCR3736003.1 3-oxoacyl-[acyl-carrier protein] reductase [Prauserella salsuginis]